MALPWLQLAGCRVAIPSTSTKLDLQLTTAEFENLLNENFMAFEARKVEHARILSQLQSAIAQFVRARSNALNLSNLASLTSSSLSFTLGQITVVVESDFPESGFRLKAEGAHKISERFKSEDELRPRLAYIVGLALSLQSNSGR